MTEDGITKIYNVYKGTKYIGELKRLSPGIDMIVTTCESTGNDIRDYTIVLKSDNSVVWSGFSMINEIQCND